MDLTVFIDYQCPYSDRAVRWLEGLGPDRVRVRYRLFSLEQVNRDQDATSWRLWDQPLDYEHYRGHDDRRSLAAFLVTKVLEAFQPGVVAQFRLAVFGARFREGADISSIQAVRALAVAAGADPGRLDALLADPGVVADARRAIAEDWAAARERYRTFGVPTLDFGAGAPLYLRLERDPAPDEGRSFFDRLAELRRAAPFLLELKAAEAAS